MHSSNQTGHVKLDSATDIKSVTIFVRKAGVVIQYESFQLWVYPDLSDAVLIEQNSDQLGASTEVAWNGSQPVL